MNKAAAGVTWLRSSAGAWAFLARVHDVCVRYPVDVHAFCFLPRHYHLLVRAELAPLRAALADLERSSKFPAVAEPRRIPVAFGRHLMSVSRYIHLNPVDAGLVWCPEHWPHSSFHAYLGDTTAPRWLSTSALLGRFGNIGARHRHRAYVYAGMDPGTRDRDGRPRWSALFASGSLAEDLAWRIEPALVFRAQPAEDPAGAPPRSSLHALARAVGAAFEISVEDLRSVGRGGPAGARARGAFVHAARALAGYRLRDVAAWMRYASPAVAAAAAERFDRAVRADPGLARRLRYVLLSATPGSRSAPPERRPVLSSWPCSPSGTRAPADRERG